MPRLSQHKSQKRVKICLLGDSGSGKTGALASLAEAGRELVILDFDNGLDFLVHLLRKRKPEALEKIRYVTLRDKYKAVGGQMIIDGVPQAFATAMNLLTNWNADGENLGPISSWPPERILVIDSASFMAKACLDWCEALGVSKDGRAVYFEAQSRFENAIAMLTSDSVNCSVILSFHIHMVQTDQVIKGYPATIGRALGPDIPKYFNAVLRCKTKGTGPAAARVISTAPEAMIDLKVPLLPSECPSELPIETGLEQYFKLLTEGK